MYRVLVTLIVGLCAIAHLGCSEPTDGEICGQMPSECVWGAFRDGERPSDCGTRICGERYTCACDRESGRWEVTVHDCLCEPPDSFHRESVLQSEGD